MEAQRSADVGSYWARPAYGVAVLFVFLPVIDTLSQVWPIAIGRPSWRYGTVGLGANYLVSVTFGMLLLSFVASMRLHRRTLLALAIANGAIAALALIAAFGFILDALQLRPGVPKAEERTLWVFDVGVAKAVLKYVAAALVTGWLALASRRAWRAIPRPEPAQAPKLVREQTTAE